MYTITTGASKTKFDKLSKLCKQSPIIPRDMYGKISKEVSKHGSFKTETFTIKRKNPLVKIIKEIFK